MALPKLPAPVACTKYTPEPHNGCSSISHAQDWLWTALHKMNWRQACAHSLLQPLRHPYVMHGPNTTMCQTKAVAEPSAAAKERALMRNDVSCLSGMVAEGSTWREVGWLPAGAGALATLRASRRRPAAAEAAEVGAIAPPPTAAIAAPAGATAAARTFTAARSRAAALLSLTSVVAICSATKDLLTDLTRHQQLRVPLLAAHPLQHRCLSTDNAMCKTHA